VPLNLIVMRASVFAVSLFLGGCASNPQSLCAALVPSSWTYLRQPPSSSAGVNGALPKTPYRTGEGKLVASARRVWYSRSDELIACTLDRHATDTCSVITTQFSRSGAGWAKVADNAVLCKISL
jgi:hypothetical protein